MEQTASAPSPDARPLRVWPAALLTAVYWIYQIILTQLDMPMFSRFVSKTLGHAVFLLVFLVLWFTNGTVRGLTRLLGFGALIGACVLGVALRDRSFDGFAYIITTVPYILSAWTAWMIVGRLRPLAFCRVSLTAVLLLTALGFDLIRWEGIDGRLHPSFAFRWSATAEQAFLTAHAAASPTPERPSRSWTPAPGDALEFRGALRDGAVRGVRVASAWKEAPPLLWKRKVGPGWSSMIVVNGNLVTQEQRGDSEAIVCYDAATAAELWCHQAPARFTEGLAGPGPRATPTFRDGRIYALGGAGLLACLDASTGRSVWSKELAKDAQIPPPQWGFSSSPLVVDGKVLVFIGGAKSRGLLAVDAPTGNVAWTREGQESYSSAQLFTIAGTPQIVMHDTRRLAGLSLADGTILWEKSGDGPAIIPMLQPQLLPDGTLLIGAAQGIALIEIRQDGGRWTVADKWASKRLKPSFNDFVVHEGYAYGLDDGVLCCVNLKDGERAWKRGRYGGGQIVLLPDSGALIVISERGEIAIVEAKPQDPGDVPRFPAVEGKTWNHPAIVGDRLFVRNGTEMACYRLPAR